MRMTKAPAAPKPAPVPEPETAPVVEPEPEPVSAVAALPAVPAFVAPESILVFAAPPEPEPEPEPAPEPASEFDPLDRVVSLILSGTAPLQVELAAAGQIDPTANPLGALREDLTRFAPDALSPIERMRLLAAHDRLVRLAGRLAQPPRPVPARR